MESPSPKPLPPVDYGRRQGEHAGAQRRRRRKRASDHAPAIYAACDALSGWLLITLVVFTPWAFGSVDVWAVRVATAIGLLLGLLLVAKHVSRRQEEYPPPRWSDPAPEAGTRNENATRPSLPDYAARILAVVQILALLPVAISLVNATRAWDPVRREFTNLGGGIAWLPQTLDRATTGWTLVTWLGLLGTFWAARDWLLYRSARDRRDAERLRDSGPPTGPGGALPIPTRLRQLLWVLSVNGALLAICGFLQRASGTNRLLGLRELPGGAGGAAAFGPWPGREGAAQYFNLLWPVCLAFWLWMQERAARLSTSQLARFDGPQLILLPCAIFMAACPAISGNRGAGLISLALGAAVILTLLFLTRRQLTAQIRAVTIATLVIAGLVGTGGGWSVVRGRLTRPDHVLPTGLQVETDPFTLFLRLRIPSAPPAEWTPLVHLRNDLVPDEFRNVGTLGISTDGSLVAQLTGSSATEVNRRSSAKFTQLFGDRDVLVTVVRERELRLYANGNELGTVEARSPEAPGWTGPVASRYLNVVSRSVSEVALVDAALGNDEIATAVRSPLAGVGERLLSARSLDLDPFSLTNGLAVPDGVEFELRPDKDVSSVKWLALRRVGTPGAIRFRRTLSGTDPGLHGAVRVRFLVRNPGGINRTLAVSADNGEAALFTVPARSLEREVAVRCRVPHDGPPRAIEVIVADASRGRLAAVLAPDEELVLRDVSVLPGTTLAHHVIDPDLRLGSLPDRIGGRPEVRENARQMAAQYPFWGTGAGTFAAVYPAFARPGQADAPNARNDWLQTRVTLGWYGLATLCLGLVVLALRAARGRGLPTIRVIRLLPWAAIAGCLVNALFGSPLQVHSILTLLVVVAAMTMALGPARQRR